MEILTVKDIQKNYPQLGGRDAIYEILRRPKCPLISGRGRKLYRIEKSAFEEFLKRGLK